MTQTNTAAGLQWKWRQPEAFKRYHEMSCEGEVIATLGFSGMCGSLATVQSAYGSWTFKRGGFLTQRITVREAGEATDRAVFFPKWTGGGEFRFNSGETYTLKCLSFWGGDWAFEDQRGRNLIYLHGPHGLIRNQGEIEVDTTADRAVTTLLAAVAWYTRLLMNEDAAASIAVMG